MWIVRLALRRPYTFVVAALVLVLLGIVTIRQTAVDIFPEIDIPVVSVIWSYGGISPQEMEGRIVTISERAMTTTVNGIEHIESTSLNGTAVIRIYFQPGTKIEAAVAQITAINQTILRILPPGGTPPLVIRYSASNVPILQTALGSKTLNEQELYDLGLNFIRRGLATVQGAQVPLPYGGKARQIIVDLDPQKLTARGLSPSDVSLAFNAQNVILPAGTAKFGETEYNVRTNSSPDLFADLNDLPVRQTGNSTIYVRDVANVRDGFAPQTSMVHVDGVRSSLLTILKSTGYSTLDIVSRVKQTLPRILDTIPPGVDVKLLLDQSIFVRAAIGGVLKEAAIAGGLTALMILLFLGSWRSTIIIAISIPLAMIASVICLAAMGHTINTMTLGGLGLAVGVLVDDATVEIENIHRNLAQRKPILRAILDGAQQIAVPAFVSTLVICIVFLPVFFISGSAKFLFVPLSLAVVFAMLASYILSRTLVPTMARTLLAPEVAVYAHGGEHASGSGPIWAVHRVFNAGFEWFKGLYELALAWVLSHRLLALVGFAATVGVGALGVTRIGQDFFPTIDSGQIRLHVRCPAGTRIESSEQYFLGVEEEIRRIIPPSDLGTVIDNIGLPAGGVNLAFSDSSTVSAADGEILISLTPDRVGRTADYVKAMRSRLAATYPDLEFFFQSPDIVSQILNFGLAAPIDIQVTGPNKVTNEEFAQKLIERIEKIPGATDVHTQQVVAAPEISVDIDRTRAVQAGLTQRDVASSVLTSLSGTGQAAPNYWLNPKNGVNYLINVQTPQYRVGTLEDLAVTPLSPGANAQGQLIEGLATTHRTITPVAVGHYNIQSVTDVLVSVEGSDLGRVGRDVDKVINEIRKELPKNTQIIVRGQYLSMRDSFNGLAAGLVGAILLAYFLMVVNFQSWTDPLIIVTALPGALAGVVAMLLLTHTTLNVPSLMGTIMCVGVATSNSILLVTFANDYRRDTGVDAIHAAWAAGRTRLRPVLMTAAAMIIGMVPMAIGLGEGGEQNAPLGRAVIGGLLFATVATLLIVPVFYSILRKNVPVSHDDLEKEVSLA